MRIRLGVLAVAALVAAIFTAGIATAGPRIKIEVGDSPSLGPKDAPVTMMEFIDFQ